MDVTRIVAIRHGETAWNAESRLQGQLDSPLNARGRAQAATLAGALHDEGLVAVYASDLGRAWQTAQALAAPLGLPLVADPGLRERGFGLLEGLTYAEIDRHWPDLARRWRSREPGFAPGGGESLIDFSARCLHAVARLSVPHRGQAIALVCHGGVLDSLCRAANRMALDAPRTWQLRHAAINRLLHTPAGFMRVGWDDGRHLQGLCGAHPGADSS